MMLQAAPPMHPEPVNPGAVLDTNTVLALWWFDDPRGAALRHAVQSAALRWWATPPMREELAHVLARLPARGRGAHEILADFDRNAQMAPVAPQACALRCRDPADQPFVDLALQRRAAWLFTRDRALLALYRRATAQGLLIVEPERWTPPAG